MNILLISYYNPLGKGGFERQTIGFLEKIVYQGHNLGCITFAKADEANNVHSEIVKTKLFVLGVSVLNCQEKSHSVKTKIKFWLSKNTSDFLAKNYHNLGHSILNAIESIKAKSNIDLIHIHGLKTAYIFSDRSEIPFLIDLLDSFTLHEKRNLYYYLRTKKINQLLIKYLDYLKIKKIETGLLNKYANKSYFVMISNKDAVVLKKQVPSADIRVISAGTYQPNASFEEIISDKQEKIISFCGFFSRIHNIDAFFWLIDSIIPLVHQKYPELILEVTGFAIPQEVYKRQDKLKWLKVVQEVGDINAFLRRATLICWPFRYGAGVKTKILESMALGKAIVSTTIGVEALTLSQRKGILVSDNAKGLAELICQLLSNPKQREELGAINLEIIKSEFTWEKRAEEYLQLYRSISS